MKEGHVQIDRRAWMKEFPRGQFDESYRHLAVVRSEEIVVGAIASTPMNRRAATALAGR